MRSVSTLLLMLTVAGATACQIDRSGLSGAGFTPNIRGSADAGSVPGPVDSAAGDNADTGEKDGRVGTAGSNGGGVGGAPASGGAPGSGGAAGVGGSNINGVDGGAGAVGGAGGTPPGCIPGVQGTLIAGCGYATAGPGPGGGTMFNENEILRAIQAVSASSRGTVRAFYNDEHALTLGVRSVVVKSASGSATTEFPVALQSLASSGATDPQIGTTELTGDRSGLDLALRPMWPALFISDITSDPANRAGDWQAGGRAYDPSAVFGTWKAAVRMVDTTKPMVMVTLTPDPDPPENGWLLPGGDPVPPGLVDQGFGAEIRWDVDLAPGHLYRLQVIVHDGDQNPMGGDAAQACLIFCAN